MKLTKKKLEQLIMEEYRSMNQRTFDKRRQYPEGGLIRAFGDEDQPINRPELHDKLTKLGSQNPEGFHQAKELADSIDKPLDIELDPNNMKTFNIQSTAPVEMQHGSWFDYVMTGHADDFESPIDMDRFKEYAKSFAFGGQDIDELYDKLESERIKMRQKIYINQPRTEVERRRELEKLHGLDLRDDWMKRSSWEH